MPESESKYMHLETEEISEKFRRLDMLDTLSLLKTINEEDSKVPGIVAGALPVIAKVTDAIAGCIGRGGRLIYVGAGTAGRIGFLDAAECVPTFGIPTGTVVSILAGGVRSMTKAKEGAEDCAACGAKSMNALKVHKDDFIIGIAASGKAPFVIGAMKRAKERGATSAALVNVSNAAIAEHADYVITLLVGPEVIAGSSRMKAGMSEKLVLNMISSAVFVKLGRVYDNMMIELKPHNEKMKERSVHILSTITGADYRSSADALERAGWSIKTAAVMIMKGVSVEQAEARLSEAKGNLRNALL